MGLPTGLSVKVLIVQEFPQPCNFLGLIKCPYGTSFSPFMTEGLSFSPHISPREAKAPDAPTLVIGFSKSYAYFLCICCFVIYYSFY
jgi:hypothetical protein